MCYIFRCVGWILDAIQRLLTFALACIIMIVICIGITMAIIAGIAYGYHYSMAEFLTFTRQDVAVYVRRGQWHDKPELSPKFRRYGDDDPFSPNNSVDYLAFNEKQKTKDIHPIENTWFRNKDSKGYAHDLTKLRIDDSARKKPESKSWIAPAPGPIFTTTRKVEHKEIDESQFFSTYTPPETDSEVSPRIMSVPPNLGLPTAVIPGRTEIIMRDFRPIGLTDYVPTRSPTVNVDYVDDYNRQTKTEEINNNPKNKPPDIKINVGDHEPERNYRYRHWGITPTPPTEDFTVEDVDEDKLVYSVTNMPV